MARVEPIHFHVPASAANLGPGYGVLALALDLPLHIAVESRGDGELRIERSDDPGAHLEDARHDPVLRGLRAGAELLDVPLQRGWSIRVEGTIPRGTGMGTISAGFAAGLGVAARLARKKAAPGALLDQLVALGGDPAHGAASMLGGLCATVPTEPGPHGRPRLLPLQHPLHAGWQFVIALPDVSLGTADSKRVLPPTVPHGAATRSSGRIVGMLRALESGDETLLRACIRDELHIPYRRHLFAGLERTLAAAVDAGAAGATICGHGPGLIAMTTDAGRTNLIARAMESALHEAGHQATSLVLQAAHYGALPLPA